MISNLKDIPIWKTVEVEKDGATFKIDFYSATVAELGVFTTTAIAAKLVTSGFGGRIPNGAKDALKMLCNDEPVGTVLFVIDGEPEAEGYLHVHRVDCHLSGPHVLGDYINSVYAWRENCCMVFCRKEESKAA